MTTNTAEAATVWQLPGTPGRLGDRDCARDTTSAEGTRHLPTRRDRRLSVPAPRVGRMGWKWAPFFVMEWLGAAGIEPHEVLQVLQGEHRWPRAAVSASNGLRPLTIWGRTRTGRALIVAVRHLDGRDWEIVGARALIPQELAELEKWEADRG